MPYPANLRERDKRVMAALRQDVKRLQSRTACIDSGWPLAALPAVISGSYVSGNPHVYINGAMTLSGPYQYLASYTPAANDNVLIIPVGVSQTYVIIGKLS
jgi:hypothetical protein